MKQVAIKATAICIVPASMNMPHNTISNTNRSWVIDAINIDLLIPAHIN